MSDLDNNLCFWNVGDTISANRLNQMVCKINSAITYQNGSNSGTNATNSGGKPSSNTGKYDRHLHYMHTLDGVGKVIDSFVNTKITDGCSDICEGIYARRTGVSGANGVLYHPCNTTLTRISCIADGIELYQKITTDNTGNPTNSEIVRIAAGESVPYPQMWKYAGESTGTGGCGVIYNRLSRTVVDCRVSCGTRAKSMKYTTIKTNDFFIPPVAQNATNEHHTLIKPMVGNTVPVRTLRPSCGITMTTCDSHIDVELIKANSATSQLGGVYSITMDSAVTNPSINNGQIVIPTVAGGCSTHCHTVKYSCQTPQPNICGWVQTMLLCNVAMLIPTTCCYTNMYYRQLMRFNGNNLEVSYQYKIPNGGTWLRGPLDNLLSITSMNSL